ncbi:MATE efflux family protein, partial [Cucurbitaria berberidis CBS 394.84]
FSIDTETTTLLGNSIKAYGSNSNRAADEDALILKEEISDDVWRKESAVIAKSTAPLVVTFLLQYSLTVASVFTLGHLGKTELGGISLASMTANITGYVVYQGLATCLDTLCSQAYGSGEKRLVGLYLQRMVAIFTVLTLPIAMIWFFSGSLLMMVVPDKEVAMLAGRYLRILIFGAPGYAFFECGKHYLNAQGLFLGPTYVLLLCAPLNAFMNWFFVWKLGWGFVGAPIAVAITDNLLSLLLFLYVYVFAGMECWDGLTTEAFANWAPMIHFALPGLVMVEAEYLAFEIMTFSSSYLSTTLLAAQSILVTISSIAFQLPFPLSISASTRIGNLIGANRIHAAQVAAQVSQFAAVLVGLINVVVLLSFRFQIPRLFTSDQEVAGLVAEVLPLCAAFQLFDALTASCNGVLRGVGRQNIGCYVQLLCYYVVAVPFSLFTAFVLGWNLLGLWSGVALALALVSLIETIYIQHIDWQGCVEVAMNRNVVA